MLMKRYFNMVEVMLAIVVISVGLASVFVLFPAGLNAHKKATADSSIADLAELVISSVRTQIDIDTSSGDNFSEISWANYDDKSDDTKVEIKDTWEVVDLLKTGDKDNDDVQNASLLRHKDKENVFWVRQVSGPKDERFVDFSAIARVYCDKNSFNDDYFFDYKAGSAGYRKGSALSLKDSKGAEVKVGEFLLPMVLEISYPAEVPYSEREKRYFRFEVFNEYYTPVKP